MKQLYIIISILLCFIFVLGCADVTSGPNNGTQPNSDDTTGGSLQADDPADTTVADETGKPDETTGDAETGEPNDTAGDVETGEPSDTADDIETAEPVPSPPPDETLPYSPDPSDRTALIREEDNKLISSFERDSDNEIIYPDDYAGTYDGDDGYLHIMVTSSTDDVDYYTAIVDPSIVRFHTVKYSLNQLIKVCDLLDPKMTEFKLVNPAHTTEDNKVKIVTSSSDMVDDITAFLDEADIDPDTYEITVYTHSIIPM